MTGRKTGVVVKFKQLNPFCLSIHCMAHRLNLATSQAANAVSYVKRCEEILTDIYNYVKKSNVRIGTLKAIQNVLDLPQVKIKEVHDIRWCAFYEALSTVHRCWPALIKFFQQSAEKKIAKKSTSKEHNKNKQSSSRSKSSTSKQSTSSCNCSASNDSDKPSGPESTSAATTLKSVHKIATDIGNYKFVSGLHMLMDIIPMITQLNLIFQKQNLDIASIGPAIQNVLKALDKIETSQGFYQKELQSKIKVVDGKHMYGTVHLQFRSHYPEELNEIKRNFTRELRDRIMTRFPTDARNIVNAFDAFGMRQLSFLEEEKIDAYGKEEMSVLGEFYGTEKTTQNVRQLKAIVDTNAANQEWVLLKDVVRKQNYPVQSMQELWKYIHKFHSSSLPNLMKLAEIAMLLPLHTADVERGFSCQNLIKTSLRNSLSSNQLDELMIASLLGPNIEDFPFDQAIAKWKAEKKRKIFQ